METVIALQRCFNPRLREGGDQSIQATEFEGDVSIHASAREATTNALFTRLPQHVSIHASAREATIA